MQFPCQQNFFVFTITPLKEKSAPKDHVFKRFWTYVCPFVTTWHERIKNSSDMIFSTMQIFLVVLLSESINEPLSNVWNSIVLLF